MLSKYLGIGSPHHEDHLGTALSHFPQPLDCAQLALQLYGENLADPHSNGDILPRASTQVAG